jgi:hypothetical protein
MRKVSLFGIAITMMLAGIAAWANSSHSAVKAAIAPKSTRPRSRRTQRICPVRSRSIRSCGQITGAFVTELGANTSRIAVAQAAQAPEGRMVSSGDVSR